MKTTNKKYNLYDSKDYLVCSFQSYQQASVYKLAYGNRGWYIK